MFKNIYKKFFLLIFFLFLLALFLITFNTNLRKSTLNSVLNSYKIYMIVSMQTLLKQPEPDYNLINNKLKNFIIVSEKISSGKSRLLIGIYDVANLVQSSIVDEKNYGALEEFFLKLTNLDPSLYEAKIWYAKSLYANNKIEESIIEIDKAIALSPLDPEPYRLALQIFLNQKNTEKFNFYCNKYLESEFGGKQKRFQLTKFDGFNFNDFAIRLETLKSKDENDYIIRGINNGKFDQYELIPEKPSNISLIKMIFSFNPGVSLEIKNLKLFSENNIYDISEKDLVILSKNTFFNNNTSQNQIFFSAENNEIVNLRLDQVYKKIDKIVFTMKFDKLNLVNSSCK